MLPDGERNSPPAAVCMGTSVVLRAVAGLVAGRAVVAGTLGEAAGDAGTLGEAAGDAELQATRESAAANTTAAVLACLPVILTVARYTQTPAQIRRHRSPGRCAGRSWMAALAG